MQKEPNNSAMVENHDQNHYVDILILAALNEETFLLDKLFDETNDKILEHRFARIDTRETFQIPCVEVSLQDGGSVRIAWMDLDGMCNVFAYDKAFEAISAASPRCVLLIGFAAGKKDVFKRGDVSYAKYIGYGAHQKIESEPLSKFLNEHSNLRNARAKKRHIAEIEKRLAALRITPAEAQFPKPTVRDAEIMTSWPAFTDAAQQKATDSTQWRITAERWWKKFLKAYNREYGERKVSANGQKRFERHEPKAHEAIVASGESVIADPKMLDKISDAVSVKSKRKQQNSNANVFEMEAYGVGLCCKQSKVPFAFVKGISDFGGVDKQDDSRKKDAFHLAAIASATAFSLDVVLGKHFVSQLQGQAHYGWGKSACIWSDVDEKADRPSPFPCYKTLTPNDSTLLKRSRPCTRTELLGLGKSELLGSRVLEDVDLTDYSNCLSRLVGQNDKIQEDQQTRLILIFPYDVRSLLDFFRRVKIDDPDAFGILHAGIDKMQLLVDVEATPTQAKNIKELAVSIGSTVHGELKHFSEINHRCAQAIESGAKFKDIAQKYCRVIYLPKMGVSEILAQPAFIMHICTCGVCVPTLLAIESERLHLDEATYVIKHRGWCPPERPVTVCMKHLPRSKLLALASTCDVIRSHVEYGKVFEFSEQVKGWIGSLSAHGGSNYAGHDLKLFPIARLLSRYEITLKDVYPRHGSPDKKKVKDYFTTLQNMENHIAGTTGGFP